MLNDHPPLMGDGPSGSDNSAPRSCDAEPGPAPFPIAIVGMAMRLPGGVNCEKEFWDLLVNKRDGLCRVPESRYTVDSYYKDSTPGAIRTQHGYFLQNEIGCVDAGFFGMSKVEAAKLDPQQRMLLEVVWECMENGAQTGWRGRDIGCYVGVFGEEWLDLMSKDTQAVDRWRVVSTGDFALSNRVSYEFDLRGPSVTYRTGCSSSLVGLHEACQALYSGECSSALAAGTSLIMTPTTTTSMSDNMVLSTSGICRTFDAAADGYGRGEAVNALFIKPLDAALKDGDPVRAVIRSTAVNCDGRTPSITTPGSQAQEQLIRKTYQRARIQDLSKTGFFECHGTGTVVGDTAEVSVVAKVFGEHGIHIGAVKPNVGHSEGASGITSVIKSVLALENKTIPPNIHFQNPNPNIPFKDANLQVPLEPTPWPNDRAERVSVNSFGIGGTNAHLIMDSVDCFGSIEAVKSKSDKMAAHLLILSARTANSLDGNIKAIANYLSTNTPCGDDIASTLAYKREHMAHRAFAILGSDGTISPFEKTKATNPQVFFVFTGQGAQWQGMGQELLYSSMKFRQTIAFLDEVLQNLDDPPSWTLEDQICHCTNTAHMREASIAQPLCTAVQIGLVDVLLDWGIEPHGVIGHSSGEMAAAYASGAIPAESAVRIAYYRGLSVTAARTDGAMALVGLGVEQTQSYLKEGVVIACENSPQSVTISGDKQTLEDILADIQADDDIYCKPLPVNVAYHSHHMAELGQQFETGLLPHLTYKASMAPMFSTVTEHTFRDPHQLTPAYWRQNLISPVLFSSAVQRVLDDGDETKLFLEIGPHSTLSAPLRQIFAQTEKKNAFYAPSLVRNKNAWQCLMATAGQLHIHGTPANLSHVVGPARVLTDLPPYSWEHNEVYWSETRLAREWRLHIEPAWRNMIQLDNILWLLDHKIAGEVVYPCAGYVAMVGEAVRQITGSSNYTVRNIFIRSALILKHLEPGSTEIVTSLRPLKLADNVDSVWYDFSISAHQDGVWKKHCIGQVRPGPDHDHEPGLVEPYSRRVDAQKWYSALESRGLEYGPYFQGLGDITASPSSLQAAALIEDNLKDGSNQYALHPVTIDLCLQLLSVAATQGISRRMTRLCIPTAIESMYIGEAQGLMPVGVSCDVVGTTLNGNAVLTAGDQVALSMKRGFFFSVADSGSDDNATPLASTVHWKPHVDFMPSESLFPLPVSNCSGGAVLAELTGMAVVDAYHQTKSISPKKEHFIKYRNWLGLQYHKIRDGVSDLTPEMRVITTGDAASRRARFEKIGQTLHDQDDTPILKLYTLIERVMLKINEIMEEKVDPLDLLLENDGLDGLYEYNSVLMSWDAFLSTLAHSQPTIRILEVGGGTGGTTSVVLNALASNHGQRFFFKYTFTDISPTFVSQAKDKFKSYQGIEYSTLDITKAPGDQGFETASYDLIIASNVLHATPKIRDSLDNLRKLIAPGGRLLLQELCHVTPILDFIMGILPSWWLAEDGRVIPYISPGQWHQELIEADFTGADIVRYDNDYPYHINASILSRPRAPQAVMRDVSLLCPSPAPEWAKDLEQALRENGVGVKWTTLADEPSAADMIALLDLDRPFFDGISQEDLNAFQRIVSHWKKGCTLWLTRSIQLEEKHLDPRYAQTLGVLRTIRQETGRNAASLEIDNFDSKAAHIAVEIFKTVRGQHIADLHDLDHEFALRNGIVHVGRFSWGSFDTAMATMKNDEPRTIDVACPGMLDSLVWASPGREAPLENDQVEVDVKYVGLNFRDIMIAMGLMGASSEIGLEASGIVRAVGSAVTNVRAGDRVAMGGNGLMGTRKIVPASLCVAIPEQLSLEAAAAGSCVFNTVIYSLFHAGGLRKGQSVLIHSACGGVGLAAIQICKMVGAEIFATVGSKEKLRHLTEEIHIPEDHIFNSRSPSFLHGVMRMTNNRGVDLVLNSLSGELLHASWRCVASFGKMIELGKRDFLGHAQLDMDIFAGNRSFIGVDLLQLVLEDPEILRQGLVDFFRYFHEGKVSPIEPVTVYNATDISQAFRYMQSGQHIGKIVIRMPDEPPSLPISRLQDRTALFRDNASYLLVGGLGGIGRSVSLWMVERGARHLVILSRSGRASSRNRAFIEDLESEWSCRVTAVTGSVTSIEDTRRAVAAAEKPMAGVMQMAMVLRNQAFERMSHEEWSEALAPKVQGTWNLHHAVHGQDLDFFLLFGSMSGLCGFAGQANYGAGNSFVDSFVTYRHSKGLPASVINLGYMGDVGCVSESAPETVELVRTGSWQVLGENDLLRALELSVLATPEKGLCQLAVGFGTTKPLSEIDSQPLWGRDARFSAWNNVLAAGEEKVTPQHEALKRLMSDIRRDPSLLYQQSTEDEITVEMGRMVASNMSYADDLEYHELANIPIDSLMTIEIRNWLRRHVKVDISLVEISNAGTVAGLSKAVIKALQERHASGELTGDNIQTVTTQQQEQNEIALCLNDKELGTDIQPIASRVGDWACESEGLVFLTGATGFLGAFFLALLAKSPQVKGIACLIRATDEVAGLSRVREVLSKYRIPFDFEAKVRIVPGDLAVPAFGLGQERYSRLAQESSVVFHLATFANYRLPYSSHRDTNICGFLNVLNFANTMRLKPLHYASTISACGVSGYLTGHNIPEDGRPGFDITYIKQHLGYTQSKMVAESIAWNVVSNGFPLTIHRPGFVSGHSVTGAYKMEDAINRLMASSIGMGVYPVPPSARNQFIPVDSVCTAMLRISLSNENLGHSFNIVRLNQDDTVSWRGVFELLGQCSSRPLRCVSPSEWIQRLAEKGGTGIRGGASIVTDKVRENMIWWGIGDQDMAVYETDNLRRALSGSPDPWEIPPVFKMLKTYYPLWAAQK